MKPSPIPSSMCRQVLIVEDETRLRDMLLANLVEMDLDPVGVASAESATKLLSRQSFDIALIDLNLPGAGGLSLCEHIHRQFPTTQMIILTGFGDLDAARKAFRLDVVDFLQKPCGMDELEMSITRARSRCLDQTKEFAAPIPLDDVPPPPEAASPGEAVPLDEMERRHILAVLTRHNGNRETTAAELEISVRKLYYRLQQWHQQGLLPDELSIRARN